MEFQVSSKTQGQINKEVIRILKYIYNKSVNMKFPNRNYLWNNHKKKKSYMNKIKQLIIGNL